MASAAVQRIESDIAALTASEVEEVSVWLEKNYSHPFDARIKADFLSGRLDEMIRQAMEEASNGGLQPL